MASFHSRSNSFPSQSHPEIECIGDHLNRLKSSQATSTSVCSNFASLRDLHERITDMIQMPSIQHALCHEQSENWINQLLERSLKLVDLCGSTRDIVYLTKESVQDLESSIRRNKAETATTADINAYVALRKKITKMVNNCIKNLKSFNLQNCSTLPDNEKDLKAIWAMLKETESLDSSVLKSALVLLLGGKDRSNQRSQSWLSKFTQRSSVCSEGDRENGSEDLCLLNIHKSRKIMDNKSMLKQLKESEMTIQELEEGLESLFRCLVKTRVSLLNVLSH